MKNGDYIELTEDSVGIFRGIIKSITKDEIVIGDTYNISLIEGVHFCNSGKDCTFKRKDIIESKKISDKDFYDTKEYIYNNELIQKEL